MPPSEHLSNQLYCFLSDGKKPNSDVIDRIDTLVSRVTNAPNVRDLALWGISETIIILLLLGFIESAQKSYQASELKHPQHALVEFHSRS